jgi:anti-anti-sigma factor
VDRTTNGRVRAEPLLEGSEGEHTLLGIVTEHTDGGVVLRLSGEIDLSNTRALVSAISAHEEHLQVLDLREITFIDCSGMQALVDATARARAGRRRLPILPGPALLHLTGRLHQQDMLDLATPP